MLAVNDDTQSAFTVHEENERFEVCATSGRVVITCDDENSASHYATLLNEAHRAGYKLSYRDGRKKE